MRLSRIVEYLKDPYLVANIQHFFGVRIHYDVKSSNDVKCNNDKEVNGHNVTEGISNGYAKRDLVLPTEESHISLKQRLLESETPLYTITNHFWYNLFLFGTELGDEIFYSTFIPFWFWNIDGIVGRRVILVWATVMSIGQALKDVICWPRPACPPAVRLQNKWSQEYGMPSTHAMVGVSIPFSVLLFTMNRYIYPFSVGCTIAFLWCTLICVSRLYLGMHTVLDIVVGLLLAVLLMVPLVPLVDIMDFYITSNIWALGLLVAATIATIIYYPCSDRWTPTRGDTAMVVSVTAGVHVGAWLNYKTGMLTPPPVLPPYNVVWPSCFMLGCIILRMALGFCSVIITKVLSKSFCYTTMCTILKINAKELMKSENYLGNKNKVLVDLVHKYISCFMIGINTVYLLPKVFTAIGIEQPTFYTTM